MKPETGAESWVSPAGYPDPERTRPEDWAWEFLRRNPQYRAEWRDYDQRCSALRIKYGVEAIGTREPTEFAWSVHEDIDATGYDPPRLTDETEDAWLQRVGKENCAPLGRWLCGKWGIAHFLPPNPADGNFRASWTSAKETFEVVWNVGKLPPWKERVIWPVVFDLRYPLEPQLEVAKKNLIERQKILIKDGTVTTSATAKTRPGTEYRRYLQVLDALEAMDLAETKNPPTAAIRELGEALFPQEENLAPEYPRDQKIRQMIPRARRLRDSDYLVLPSTAASASQ